MVEVSYQVEIRMILTSRSFQEKVSKDTRKEQLEIKFLLSERLSIMIQLYDIL